MYSIYIYTRIHIYKSSTTTNRAQIPKIIQSKKHCLDHLLQFYACSFFFFPYCLPPLVFSWHEDKSLTPALLKLYSSSTKSINNNNILERLESINNNNILERSWRCFFASSNYLFFLKNKKQLFIYLFIFLHHFDSIP